MKIFPQLISPLIISGFLVLVALLLINFSPAHAQSQIQFISFWHAASYVPANFTGKILPTEKTNIQASFELLKNGKFMDVSGKRITWLIGENVIGDGVGKKDVTFINHAYGSGEIVVDVHVFDAGGSILSYSFMIPATIPRLVIASPYDKNNLTEKNLNLSALPYFWNITNPQELIYAWAVNGIRPVGSALSPNLLSVTIPEGTALGTKVAVKVSAENPASGIETASNEIIYRIAP